MQIKNLLKYPVWFPYAGPRKGVRLGPGKVGPTIGAAVLRDPLFKRDFARGRVDLLMLDEERAANADVLLELGIDPEVSAEQVAAAKSAPTPTVPDVQLRADEQVVVAKSDGPNSEGGTIGFKSPDADTEPVASDPEDAAEGTTAPEDNPADVDVTLPVELEQPEDAETAETPPAAVAPSLRERLEAMPWTELRTLAAEHPEVKATGGREVIVDALLQAEADGYPVFPGSE